MTSLDMDTTPLTEFQSSSMQQQASDQSKQQQQQQVINSMHADYIYRVAFDTYGRRMATCSGDRFVRVWDLTDSGQWAVAAEWQAHRGAVTSLCWAHPEFGSLLATCGTDHDAKIWEERTTVATAAPAAADTPTGGAGGGVGGAATATNTSSSRWITRASLTEARRAVQCLEFAPRHWGLKLAVGSADGCARIYEAVDIQNLAQWPMAASLQSFSGTSEVMGDEQYNDSTSNNYKLGCTCLSWCTGRFEPPTLVVGGSHLVVYRYSETARAWQTLFKLQQQPKPTVENIPLHHHQNYPPSQQQQQQQQQQHVLDVAWAPNVGRRFHYIASAEGRQMRIYKLAREMTGGDSSNNNNNEKQQQQQQNKNINNSHLSVESSQTLSTPAWRCQWNVTGTVLACSGDGGIVQLWKSDVSGKFQCVSQIQGDLTQMAPAPPPSA